MTAIAENSRVQDSFEGLFTVDTKPSYTNGETDPGSQDTRVYRLISYIRQD